MQKRTAFAAMCLTLFVAAGATFATVKLMYNPFRDIMDTHGHLLRAESRFSGEVKLYDRDNHYLGSFGTDGVPDAPIVANVTIDGKTLEISGPGRHPLRMEEGKERGNIVGYADLIPESAAERAQWKAAHDQAMGHEETLHISNGSDDGWGTAIGVFGDEEKGGVLTWRFTGVGTVRFLHNGKVVRTGVATNVTSEEAARLRKTMHPEEFAAKVRINPPSVPLFEWTENGLTQQHTGTEPMPLNLPDGTKLEVQFITDKPATE